MTTERIKTKEKKEFYWYGDFYGSLDNIIATLQKCKKEGWEGIDYDYDYEVGKEYHLYRTRIETDEEYKKRMKEEEQRKENRRMQYEKLKKEFGND